MTELVLYEAARTALIAAVNVDEVKNVRDRAIAMQILAKQAKDSELVDKATELRLRAERRLGEMIIAQKETIGLNRGAAGGGKKTSSRGTFAEPRDTRPTLASAGIDKKLSANAQKVAALPEPAFEQHLAAVKKQASDALRMTTVEKQARRADREAELGAKQMAWPTEIYGVLYIDPPWRFEVYDRESGLDRAADNHYPTMTLDEIKALRVPSIAAPDSVVFLWTTGAMAAHAHEVMKAWGFEYKSQVVWVKDQMGTGHWYRSKHELLLVGTRGKIPAPAQGTQWSSVIEAPIGEHSRKPDEARRMIEAYFPTLPKIELFARGEARPGWSAWGNEVEPR